MKLIGQPLDIPALMLLSIAILGLGIDYAIFLVRAHQRYRVISHPSYVRVRASVFLSATSTMIGFGVLCFAEHSLLRSIGISSLLGIQYSLLGSFLLLPLLLNRYFASGKQDDSLASLDLATRICRRYRTLEPYPRLFTRFKLRLDPLFVDLPLMLAARKEIKIIVDIGCGYGVPACWCVETYKEALVFAIEPDAERVRVASLALGDRGVVTRGFAPDMPPVPGGEADVVLLLDMLHYVDEATVATLFSRSFQILADGGIVALRCSILPAGQPSWAWRWEERRNRVAKQKVWFRSPEMLAELLRAAGFVIVVKEISANPELVWLVAMAQKEASGASPLA
jgi:SAM-dependent methyltransferase